MTRRAEPPVSLLVLGAVFALIAVFASTRICDPDTMQYLASGRYIASHGLEAGCVYSYAAENCQIVYPQWGLHRLAYGLYRLGGWTAMSVAQIAVALAIFLVIAIFHRRSKIHPLVSAAALLLGVLVVRERFIWRADLFALLPAVLLYALLDRLTEPRAEGAPVGETILAGGNAKLLAAIGAVQLVWANIHGSFPIGFVLAGAFLAESVASVARSRSGDTPNTQRGRRTLTRVALACAIVAFASLLNPHGPKAFLQPFQFYFAGKSMAPQLEFLPTLAPSNLEHTTVTMFKVLLALGAALLVTGFKSLRVSDVLILGPVLFLSWNGMRYLALFGVFWALLLPRVAESVRRVAAAKLRLDTSPGRASAAAAVASLMILSGVVVTGTWAWTSELYRYDALSRRTGMGLSDLDYPTAAAEFVETQQLPGNLFNDYSVGTYLNWRLFPERKTYIDGHSYSPEFLDAYLKLMAGAVPYQAEMDRRDVNVIFLSHRSDECRPMIGQLVRDPRWVLVYLDERAVIFLKNVSGNQSWIDALRIDPRAGRPLRPEGLVNVHRAEDLYLGHTDKAFGLSAIGLESEASAELELALRLNPRNFVTLTAYGITLANRGDLGKARSIFEQAIAARPGFATPHFHLGLLDLRAKNATGVIKEMERTLRINKAYPLANLYLGSALEVRGDKTGALERYRRELRISPTLKAAQDAVRRLQ